MKRFQRKCYDETFIGGKTRPAKGRAVFIFTFTKQAARTEGCEMKCVHARADLAGRRLFTTLQPRGHRDWHSQKANEGLPTK